MRSIIFVALVGLSVAGCSSGPSKVVPIEDVLNYSPASVSSSDPTLQVCVFAARRCPTLEEAPSGHTAFTVDLTKVDGTKGDRTYASALGLPATFSVRGPWVLTLHDGFLRAEAVPGSKGVKVSVEGSQSPAPPAITSEQPIWLWIGRPPSAEHPEPRGTFIGVRQAR
ncbi:MAG: hypothetical protein ACAI25_14445 [Planctomycetota bacterium]